jgi:hypothetical protein
MDYYFLITRSALLGVIEGGGNSTQAAVIPMKMGIHFEFKSLILILAYARMMSFSQSSRLPFLRYHPHPNLPLLWGRTFFCAYLSL